MKPPPPRPRHPSEDFSTPLVPRPESADDLLGTKRIDEAEALAARAMRERNAVVTDLVPRVERLESEFGEMRADVRELLLKEEANAQTGKATLTTAKNLKGWMALISLAGTAVIAPLVSLTTAYITRPPPPETKPTVTRSAFDRALDVCDRLESERGRLECAVRVYQQRDTSPGRDTLPVPEASQVPKP